MAPKRFDGALVEAGPKTRTASVRAVRQALPGKPLGGIAVTPDAAALRRCEKLGFDFVLEIWRSGDPAAASVLAHVKGARRRRTDGTAPQGEALQTTAKRLAILTDVVKTANSILEPSKVIELVMEKIRQLIPSEAWSLLMVDEEKQELVFKAALGAKGQDLSSYRLKLGEGVAGWVAEKGKPTIVNDTSRDRRFTPRYDEWTQFATRSILCAPLISRGRTIGVLEIINKRDGEVTQVIINDLSDDANTINNEYRSTDADGNERVFHAIYKRIG